MPIVVEQAHRKKRMIVRQIVPTWDALILFITFFKGSCLIPDGSGLARTRQGRVPQPLTADRIDLVSSGHR